MNQEMEKKFQKIRRLFPHAPQTAYFNSASYGPFCKPVYKAIEENLQLRLACRRDDSHDAFVARDELRKDYAKMIGAKETEVGVGLNTTFGLNIAAFGLPLKKGDEVLLSDIEFPAGIYTWRGAAEARGLKLKFVESTNGFFDIEKLEKAITKKTKVLNVSYVQFFNGYKNDLATLSKLCKKYGLYFVVDGIQGMGSEPLDVNKLGIDMFACGCQKWMLSPQGCGFFYLPERVQRIITPPFMSWLGVDWQVEFTDLFRYDLPYFKSAEKFEMGYYAVLNLLGMKAANGVFKELGIPNIQKHNHQLIDVLAGFIESEKYYSITCCMEEKHRSSIFTFTCAHLIELHQHLLKQGIILVRREGSIRVSVHLFNNRTDIKRLIKALKEFAVSKK